MKQILETPIHALDISVRLYNALKSSYIDTLGKLSSISEPRLKAIHLIGKKTIDEARVVLAEFGLTFGLTEAEQLLRVHIRESKINEVAQKEVKAAIDSVEDFSQKLANGECTIPVALWAIYFIGKAAGIEETETKTKAG